LDGVISGYYMVTGFAVAEDVICGNVIEKWHGLEQARL
jgi:hypothetical protein